MTQHEGLKGRRILVVEDEYFIATDIVKRLEDEGCEVIGPAGTVAEALVLAETHTLDGAVIDVSLRGEMAYPVADAMEQRHIPFVFATGYSRASLPSRYANAKVCVKPVDTLKLAEAIFS